MTVCSSRLKGVLGELLRAHVVYNWSVEVQRLCAAARCETDADQSTGGCHTDVSGFWVVSFLGSLV